MRAAFRTSTWTRPRRAKAPADSPRFKRFAPIRVQLVKDLERNSAVARESFAGGSGAKGARVRVSSPVRSRTIAAFCDGNQALSHLATEGMLDAGSKWNSPLIALAKMAVSVPNSLT